MIQSDLVARDHETEQTCSATCNPDNVQKESNSIEDTSNVNDSAPSETFFVFEHIFDVYEEMLLEKWLECHEISRNIGAKDHEGERAKTYC